MATHDYDIANQSGAAFRTDLNNALAAIQSNNSNSSSPSTTVAYQFWADTSAGTLKIRNAANNDWIELLQLDGTLTLEDGSASTPALAFRDDLNTGIFSSEADHLSVSTAGTERIDFGTTGVVINDGAADYDIRVEGTGNTNLFKVDAGNDRIGIGTSSPDQLLHLAAASDGPVIRFENTDTTISADQVFGGIEFESRDASTGSAGVISKIDCISSAAFDGTTANGGELRFHTSGTNSISLLERLRIDASGLVGIGTTSPSEKLHVNGNLKVTGNLNAVSDYLEFKHFDFGTIAAGASETATLTAPKNNEQLYVEIKTVGRENTNTGTFVMRSQGVCNFAGTSKQTVGHGDFSGDESLGEGDYRTFSGGSHGLDYDGNNLRLTVTNSGSGTMEEVITLVRYQWSD
tara:strand:- start:381 stop:1595 length:1215 start_codon:yes stop_codon:yes gene_type:complete